jgi:hypothetical protein
MLSTNLSKFATLIAPANILNLSDLAIAGRIKNFKNCENHGKRKA